MVEVQLCASFFVKMGEEMSTVTIGEVKKEFDLRTSFLHSVSCAKVPFRFCCSMFGILVETKKTICRHAEPYRVLELLRRAVDCTELAFRGEPCKELFVVYCEVGYELWLIGEEDLSVACYFLHHAYGNRRMESWPPYKAIEAEHRMELCNALKKFGDSLSESDCYDADEIVTAQNGDCIPV